MKSNEIYDELVDIAKKLGITVRKENGKFHSGFCTMNERKMIILNRNSPIETLSNVLAKGLNNSPIDDIYIKPAVREFIEKEWNSLAREKNFNLDVTY